MGLVDGIENLIIILFKLQISGVFILLNIPFGLFMTWKVQLLIYIITPTKVPDTQ